jgi:hypothetical protein
MRTAHKYHQKIGILDRAGKRHKIAAYLAIEAGNWDQMMQVAYVCDAIEFGFQFQAAQDEQFETGTWDYVPGSPVEGGHAVPLFGRNAGRGGGVSWAKHIWYTQAFIENLCDEAWAIIYLDEFGSQGHNDRGLDTAGVLAALHSLGLSVG